MRFSSTRINWITFLSIFTLLISSVVSSAPLMSFQLFDASSTNQSTSSSTPPQRLDCHRGGGIDHAKMGHSVSAPISHDMTEARSLSCCSGADSEYNCCGATCVNLLTFIPNVNNDPHVKTRLSRIENLTQGERVHRPQSLYRPPRACSKF